VSEHATFDANLLSAIENEWETSARRYWSGEISKEPLPETLVDGMIYLPGWEAFPLGF